ncbi:hypothetical protein M0R45_034724 [Rubus argutus]|uniref:F-box domain-containing protein n=1 Tax=Rubus argutus TaxID=59490 RepID=A0AAW1VQZ9_RUBAR
MSDYFPEEVIQKILLRLPIKSIIKATAVCKSWMSLIKSSTFIQSHLRTTIDSNDAHLLLFSASSLKDSDSYPRFLLHWDSPESGEYSEPSLPVTFLENQSVSLLTVVGTCNGLVCLEADHFDTVPSLLIWNPCIRKIVMLPSPPDCFTFSKYNDKYTTHGFGYDSYSNDYKVLRVVSLLGCHSNLSRLATAVQVYSLARGSWKSLSVSDVPIDFEGGSSPSFVNGILHTLEARLSVVEEHRKFGGDRFIASFNLATEVFGEIMIPEPLQKKICSIKRYGDSLALIKYDYDPTYRRGVLNRGCDIWVLKEYAVAESWTFLYNIVMVEANIYGFKRCGEVVLRGQSRMLSLDPISKQVKDFRTEDYIYFMDSFVESLVLLDHANAHFLPRRNKVLIRSCCWVSSTIAIQKKLIWILSNFEVYFL